MSLPRRVCVSEIISSRYQAGERPISWDERLDGIEQIKTDSGEVLKLYSNGGQSSPSVGWELLLIDQVQFAEEKNAFSWTLYGIKPKKVFTN